jgi:hypothetical protein
MSHPLVVNVKVEVPSPSYIKLLSTVRDEYNGDMIVIAVLVDIILLVVDSALIE